MDPQERQTRLTGAVWRRVPGYSFPVIPTPVAATLRGIVGQLFENDWLERARIVRQQQGQLRTLLRFASRQCPFYAERLGGAGLDLGDGGGPIDLGRLPLLTRRDLQDSFAELRARQLPTGTAVAGELKTSGSIGSPVKVLSTTSTALMWTACYLRDLAWAGLDLRGTMVALRSYPAKLAAAHTRDGWTHPNWGGQLGAALVTGPIHGMDIGQDAEAQLALIQRAGAHYLCSYPSNLEILGRVIEERGLTFPALQTVVTIGELLPAPVRAYLERVYRAKVWDVYSCVETGYIASQCPAGAGYHVHEENVVLEILDEDNRPCAPGTAGRIVLTALTNFATPLIRYDVGDYGVQMTEPCPCGRGLLGLTEIIGRQRGQLVLPDGRVKFSSTLSVALRDAGGIRQFQVIQHEPDRVEILVVPMAGFGDAPRAKIVAAFREYLGFPIQVGFTLVEKIERTAGGKYLDFVCKVPPQPQVGG